MFFDFFVPHFAMLDLVEAFVNSAKIQRRCIVWWSLNYTGHKPNHAGKLMQIAGLFRIAGGNRS
jgi:hypothetical protein